MSDPIPVDPMDPALHNSPLTGPVTEEATVMLDQAKSTCFWNGREFPEGTVVESGGKRFECSYGKWIEEG